MSAAADAGLKVGDVIETVNDQSTAAMTLDEVKGVFRQDGSQFILGVRRGNESVRLVLKIHRLI